MTDFEKQEVNTDEYNKDMKELEELRLDKEARERVQRERDEFTKRNMERREDAHNRVGERSNDTTWSIISWIMFALVFIPFLPYKTFISIGGILAGYLHIKNEKGSKGPLIANTVVLVIRAIIWTLILLLPLFLWWPVVLA